MCALCAATQLPVCQAGGVCDPTFHQVVMASLLSVSAAIGGGVTWLQQRFLSSSTYSRPASLSSVSGVSHDTK